MASPQIERGYLRIANELVEAVCRANLTGGESSALWAVLRATYGWNRKGCDLSITAIVRATGMPRSRASDSMQSLIAKNILQVVSCATFNRARTIALNDDYDTWLSLRELDPEEIESGKHGSGKYKFVDNDRDFGQSMENDCPNATTLQESGLCENEYSPAEGIIRKMELSEHSNSPEIATVRIAEQSEQPNSPEAGTGQPTVQSEQPNSAAITTVRKDEQHTKLNSAEIGTVRKSGQVENSESPVSRTRTVRKFVQGQSENSDSLFKDKYKYKEKTEDIYTPKPNGLGVPGTQKKSELFVDNSTTALYNNEKPVNMGIPPFDEWKRMVVEAWNALYIIPGSRLLKIESLGTARLKHLRCRYWGHVFRTQVFAAIAKIGQSPRLLGIGSEWKLTFESFISSDRWLQKIIDGDYIDGIPAVRDAHPDPQQTLRDHEEFLPREAFEAYVRGDLDSR